MRLKQRSGQAWTTVCSNTTSRLLQRQRSNNLCTTIRCHRKTCYVTRNMRKGGLTTTCCLLVVVGWIRGRGGPCWVDSIWPGRRIPAPSVAWIRRIGSVAVVIIVSVVIPARSAVVCCVRVSRGTGHSSSLVFPAFNTVMQREIHPSDARNISAKISIQTKHLEKRHVDSKNFTNSKHNILATRLFELNCSNTNNNVPLHSWKQKEVVLVYADRTTPSFQHVWSHQIGCLSASRPRCITWSPHE